MPRRRRGLRPNTELRAARERLVSPSGSGRKMSTQELAEAVNAWLWDTYHQQENLTYRDVAALERGEVRWPGERRREAFRAILGARVDSDLGFHINRMTASAEGTPQVDAHDLANPDRSESVSQALNRADLTKKATVHRTGEPIHIVLASHLDGIEAEHTLSGEVAEAVSRIHRQLDNALSTSAVDSTVVSYWSAVAEGYGRIYRTSPPQPFLLNIVKDINDLRHTLDLKLLTAQRRELCGAMARMAGLLATTFVNLSDYRAARGWFSTARRAAEESDHSGLYAWVVVRHAVSALYWNDPYAALALAAQAEELSKGIPCAATAWTPAVQARVYSRLGPSYFDATHRSIDRAEAAFSTYDAAPGEQHAYGYTSAQLHFYISNALTEIGETGTAHLAQDEALANYEPAAFLDPSLVRLDRAVCLLKDGDTETAAWSAVEVLNSLPQEHLSSIVVQQARRFAAAIPRTQHALPAFRELRRALPRHPHGQRPEEAPVD